MVWGDIESDELIKPETIDRHTVDENVNFIAEEYDKLLSLYVSFQSQSPNIRQHGS